MHIIRKYLLKQLQPFDKTALWHPNVVKESLLPLLGWASPAFLIVCLVARYREHVPSAYLEAAISEGIGPHLWNVVGTLGLVLVGFALLFPRSRFIAKSAYQVLINTYAIGGLSFGLLFGQLATALSSAATNVALWKAWLMGAGSIFLAVQALSLNFSLWYLGHLMASREASDGFLHRVERVDLRLRVIGFFFLAVLPTTLLFMEK